MGIPLDSYGLHLGATNMMALKLPGHAVMVCRVTDVIECHTRIFKSRTVDLMVVNYSASVRGEVFEGVFRAPTGSVLGFLGWLGMVRSLRAILTGNQTSFCQPGVEPDDLCAALQPRLTLVE